MAVDSQVAPRRTPFEIGTVTVFVQAAPPPGWVQETLINDRFLRVVNTVGGVTGGPDNRTTDTVDLAHTHSIASHSHGMGTHTHNANHNHDLPDDTEGMVDITLSSIEGGAVAYDVKDDSDGFDDIFHLRVDGGTNNEGQHDHEVSGTNNGSITGTFSGSTASSGDSTTSTSDTTDSTNEVNSPYAATTMVHGHQVSSSFRPRYKDVILARIVN